MMKIASKILAAIVVGFIAGVAPASACITIDDRRTVFQDSSYVSADTADATDTIFSGEITLRQKRKWFFFKDEKARDFDGYVNESSTHPHLKNKWIEVVRVSGICGAYMNAGDRGFLVADIISPEGASLHIRPRTHSANGLLELQEQINTTND